MTARNISAVAILLALACSSTPTAPTAPVYNPVLPTTWVAAVTNPLFPLVPGTTYEFAGQTPGGTETVTVEVLRETKLINGVRTSVVRDRVYLQGNLKEDTIDWYAQDSQGNVWYLGEAVKDYENGVVVSTAGSFEWGVDGALPGIIMWANPAAHLSESYRQEYYKGKAEDYGRVLAAAQSATVPAGSFSGCVRIEEWNGLVNEPHTSKTYCPGMGIVLENSTINGGDRVELLRVTRP